MKTKIEHTHPAGVKLQFSQQATVLLQEMPDFPWREFDAWLASQGWLVGSGMVQEFLLHRAAKKEKLEEVTS